MGIISSLYGISGSGLCAAAVVPGVAGNGLIAAGNALVNLSESLHSAGERNKMYAAGLEMMDSGQLTADAVKTVMNENNLSFKDALISIVSGAAVIKEEKSKKESVEESETDLLAKAVTKDSVIEDSDDSSDDGWKNPDAQRLAALTC